ncbi:FecR family protein [Pedobacter deserti]|uniref:FecR family protein n=1 Tax=Pedobacter deserti TaxID=2817382 RepID=UPI00210F015A|nr:FecR domain-containing protein [Pedobacter sp. SYSU D00382]
MENYSKYYAYGQLILRHLKGELDLAEQAELDRWLNEDSRNREIFERLTEEDCVSAELELFAGSDKEAARRALISRLVPAKSVRLWPRIAVAAASVIAIIGLVLFFNAPDSSDIKGKQLSKYDGIHPGENRATLTLSNGKTIALNSSKTGVLVDATTITYADGSELDGLAAREADAATMVSTPRGGTYQVILPDGSKVWLNASSSLKFPASFANTQQREIYLQGEGYFEVAKDKSRPFVVHAAGQVVRVLGTHFNLNAYGDEPVVKTTLLEGSVVIVPDKTIDDTESALLKPGQQAVFKAGQLKISDADTEQAVAWKNGFFIFKNQTLPEIMKEVARWYDIEVRYEGYKSNLTFSGTLPRNTDISAIFRMLNATENIRLEVRGKVITIYESN